MPIGFKLNTDFENLCKGNPRVRTSACRCSISPNIIHPCVRFSHTQPKWGIESHIRSLKCCMALCNIMGFSTHCLLIWVWLLLYPRPLDTLNDSLVFLFVGHLSYWTKVLDLALLFLGFLSKLKIDWLGVIMLNIFFSYIMSISVNLKRFCTSPKKPLNHKILSETVLVLVSVADNNADWYYD